MTASETAPDPTPQAHRSRLTGRQALGMAAMALAVFVVANDFTAFSVALPAMEKSLKVDVTTIQWVINGYSLVVGVFMVTGGRLADTFGRRRMFVLGGAIFATFSLIAGLTDRIEVVLAARAIMGFGGAIMWPATIGMTYALLPSDRAGLAGGLIIGAAGIGNAVGPLVGGILTDTLGWEWIFFVNLPVTAIGITGVLLLVPKEPPTRADHRFDFIGVAILSLSLLSLLYSLDAGVDKGWIHPLILGLFGAAGVGLVAFGFIERRMGAHALVPSDVLADRVFSMAALTTLLTSAIFFAAIVYVPQFMTRQLHFSAMKSGVGFLPLMLTFAATSFVAGNLYEKLGAKASVTAGAAFLAVGMLLLARVGDNTTYAGLVPGMVVLGLGVGLYYSSITTAAITVLDPSRASLGGAIIYMCQVAGGAIGLGLNTAIVVGAKSLTVGIARAFVLDAILAGVALVLALLFIRGGAADRRHAQRHAHRPHA